MNYYIASESKGILKQKENFLKDKGLNPYKILGISKKSSLQTAKKAYENLSEVLEKKQYNENASETSIESLEYCYDYILFKRMCEKYSGTDYSEQSRVSDMTDPDKRNEILFGVSEEDDMKKEIKRFQDAENIPLDNMLTKYKQQSLSSGNIHINAPDHSKFISQKTKKFNVKKFMESFEEYSEKNADTLIKDTGVGKKFNAMESFSQGTVVGMSIKYCDGMIIPIKNTDTITGAADIRPVLRLDTENRDSRKDNLVKNNKKSVKKPFIAEDVKTAFVSKKKELQDGVFIERKSYAQAEHEMLEYRKQMNNKEKFSNKESIGKQFGLF